ncbi:MAG TPA: hypothetical protein VFN67_06965 [Polyangiales bacterium]|nr:hypothetical protein [Polyangiales bacterium]
MLLILEMACAGDARDAGIAHPLVTSATHSCALREAGLYCWGSNFAGQLGTGDERDSATPVAATLAGDDIAELALSSGRSCVRRKTGKVACWGQNELGQIGDGTRDNSLIPHDAVGIDDAQQIAIEDSSSCALRASGKVACWGMSSQSHPDEGALMPQMIEGISGIVELRSAPLGTYCGRHPDGLVECWRFQDGHWAQPFAVDELHGARAIGLTTTNEACAILESGSVTCHNFDSGNTVPLQRSEDSLQLVASGDLAICAQNKAQRWQCWNLLPPGFETVGSPAIPVETDQKVIDLTVSGLRFCSLRADQSIACADATTAVLEFEPVKGLPR